ncbi:MAG: pre-mrna splicing factor [Lasallia pustulata]|uniref:Pre-mrna splicing factor n=1 Tax=Lasallia pustulata TaxID=136370 RepID=A0A5M8PAR3_9LECA|nr:MAG: pre-mrna splicing factor [Lasallia pustulata]
MAAEVSSTRLYLGNLPREVTKEDIQKHFGTHGTGTITEIKLMTGFGFLEYEDPMDARDVVPAYRTSYITSPRALLHINYWWIDGTMLNGSRLTVQFARGSRQRDTFTAPDRTHPRPRRTAHRMQITGLPGETSWQDLKDFARRSGLDVVFSEVGRDRDGKGFVEFETDTDLKTAVEKLDNTDFKGTNVHCYADTQDEVPRDRYRSRSPLPRRNGGGYGAPADDYYGRRGPPPDRGYGERRDDYRRSSPRREYYESRESRGYRSPPRGGVRGGPPLDAPYPPPRPSYGREDPYPAPPHRHAYEDHYANGGYERPRPRSPPPARYGGYDDRPRYW